MPKLAAKEYCTGCTACASVCQKGSITMVSDEDGFLYPMVDTEHCVECGLCEKICPIVTPLETTKNDPKAYAAYSKDEALRMQSSSGGIFSEIAKAVLRDGGIVYGAAYNKQFDVVHICVETEEKLSLLRGAKYAESDIRGVFSEVKDRLDDGELVLFSGTPCQVSGLQSFLQKNYKNLITVDFVCHSVPSPMAWKEYVKYRSQQDNGGKLPQSIDLRSKQTGWSCYQYSNLFRYENGVIHASKSSESLYMKLFVGDYIARKSCENCHFKGYQRVSDITLGDFWGIWNVAPEMDDNKGTSVLLVHSMKGRELLNRISGRLVLKEVTLEEASQENGAMIKATKSNEHRHEALARIREGHIAECTAWFKPQKLSASKRIRYLVKKMFVRL